MLVISHVHLYFTLSKSISSYFAGDSWQRSLKITVTYLAVTTLFLTNQTLFLVLRYSTSFNMQIIQIMRSQYTIDLVSRSSAVERDQIFQYLSFCNKFSKYVMTTKHSTVLVVSYFLHILQNLLSQRYSLCTVMS